MLSSSAASAMPMHCPERNARSIVSPCIITPTPRFSSPTMFPAGTWQSSRISSAVGEPRCPSLSSVCPTAKPANPFSITNAVIPRDPAAGSVFAYSTSVSATDPLVMNILRPLST